MLQQPDTSVAVARAELPLGLHELEIIAGFVSPFGPSHWVDCLGLARNEDLLGEAAQGEVSHGLLYLAEFSVRIQPRVQKSGNMRKFHGCGWT